MTLTENVLNQQRSMAQDIKDKLDTIVPLDAKKEEDLDTAKAYCDGCILACTLAEEVLQCEAEAKKKPQKATEPEAAQEPAEATETPEEKPKRRSHKKKKPAKDDSMTLEDAAAEPDRAENDDAAVEPAPDNAITTEDETVDLGESSSVPEINDDDDDVDIDGLF